MFKNLNIGYDLEKAGSKSLPSQYRKYMNDYKILFTVDVALILFVLLIFMIHFDGLQTIHSYNLFTNIINGITVKMDDFIPAFFLFILSLGIIVATAREVYIGNKFSKIHKKRIQI